MNDEKYYKDIPIETGEGRSTMGQVKQQAPNGPGKEVDLYPEPLTMKEQKEDQEQKSIKGIASFESHRKQGDHP